MIKIVALAVAIVTTATPALTEEQINTASDETLSLGDWGKVLNQAVFACRLPGDLQTHGSLRPWNRRAGRAATVHPALSAKFAQFLDEYWPTRSSSRRIRCNPPNPLASQIDVSVAVEVGRKDDAQVIANREAFAFHEVPVPASEENLDPAGFMRIERISVGENRWIWGESASGLRPSMNLSRFFSR